MTQEANWYNSADNEWITTTRQVDVSEHYSVFLNAINKDVHILDLGCGAGRDSLYFHNLGFKVDAIDNSKYMCELTNTYTQGQVQVYEMDITNFNPPYKYDAIWAMASLVHADDKELDAMLERISNILKPNGVFYTMLKEVDHEWTDAKGRYYNAIDADKLTTKLEKYGFAINTIYTTEDKLGRPEKWICVLANTFSYSPELSL